MDISFLNDFTVPVILSSLLHMLFNTADMVVVGQFAGAESLAAVGSTGALINLITNLFVGFSLGANVVIAHANGARDHKAIQKNVLVAGIALGSIVTSILLLVAMATDEIREARDD